MDKNCDNYRRPSLTVLPHLDEIWLILNQKYLKSIFFKDMCFNKYIGVQQSYKMKKNTNWTINVKVNENKLWIWYWVTLGALSRNNWNQIFYTKLNPLPILGPKKGKNKKKVKSEKNFGFENDESLEWMDLRLPGIPLPRTLLKIGYIKFGPIYVHIIKKYRKKTNITKNMVDIVVQIY